MDGIFEFENKRLKRTVNKRYMLIRKYVGILTKQNHLFVRCYVHVHLMRLVYMCTLSARLRTCV